MSKEAKILIVDDDEGIRNGLGKILQIKGYDVETAETGKEAIKKSNSGFYNLALIDIRLPDMEGIQILTELGKNSPKTLKIVITGFPSLQTAMDSVNKNADAYLVKPINVDALLSKIEDLLRKQEESDKYDEEKFADFVESRARKWKTESLISIRERKLGNSAEG